MSEIPTTLGISATSLIIALLGWLIEHYKVIGDLKERISRLEEIHKKIAEIDIRLTKIECYGERLKSIEVKTDLFWKSIEDGVIEMLHKPHPEYQARDTLLEKVKDRSITKQELQSLACMLEEEISKNRGKIEAFVASLGLARVNQLIYDIDDNGEKQVVCTKNNH